MNPRPSPAIPHPQFPRRPADLRGDDLPDVFDHDDFVAASDAPPPPPPRPPRSYFSSSPSGAGTSTCIHTG
jgi:hypothetical protein